jgi:hypothetical protein
MAILEALIASVVLALAVVGLALMFSEGQSYAVADGDDRIALALAQEKLEHVKSLGFKCIPVQATVATANTPVAAVPGSGCPGDSPVPDTVDAQAARTYNETPPTTCLPSLPSPCPPPLPRYVSRVTLVRCADLATMTTAATGCSVAKHIQVELTPIMGKARGARVETVLAAH